MLPDDDILPDLPEVSRRVIELCDDPHATARDVGRLLELDPALSARILRRVNSPFYGLSRLVSQIPHAVAILGMQEIRSFVMAAHVAELYQSDFERPGIPIPKLYERAVETACLARGLSRRIAHPVPEEVFVSGMLMDAGMVVLNRILEEDYSALVTGCADENRLAEVERERLGTDHVTVSIELGRRWLLPDGLVETIRHHHTGLLPDGRVHWDGSILCAARTLRNGCAASRPLEESVASLPPPIVSALQLTPEETRETIRACHRETAEARQVLSLAS